MIDVKQLRIGNLIHPRGDCDEVVDVTDIDEYGSIGTTAFFYNNIGTCDTRDSEACGIPITPEWLEKFGFTGLEYGVWDGPKIELEDSVEWFTIEEYRGGFILKGSEWVMGKPFHSVHQLQNLYFALTGEELQIKNI